MNSPALTRILLIRHAESRPDPALPEDEWPLTDAGLRQAGKLPRTLTGEGVDVLYSSPYRRAIDTAKPFAEAAGLEIHVEEDLRERKLAGGFRRDWRELIQQAWADLSFALPGCESGLACQARTRACLDGLALRHPGCTIAAVSHGNTIALYLNSLDRRIGVRQWESIKNTDLLMVDYPPAGPRISGQCRGGVWFE